MNLHRYARPTLVGTLGHIAQTSWAIWRDYRDCARMERQRRRFARQRAVAPGWRTDWLHLVLVAASVALLFAVGLVAFDGVEFTFAHWGP